jgi:hypothetical protein
MVSSGVPGSVGGKSFRPTSSLWQKINVCNINYMAVFDILPMPLVQLKWSFSDKLPDDELECVQAGKKC